MRSLTVEWDETSIVVIVPPGTQITFGKDTPPDEIAEELRKHYTPLQPAEPESATAFKPPHDPQAAIAASVYVTIGRLVSIGEYLDDEGLRGTHLDIAPGGRIHPDVLRKSASYWWPLEPEGRWRAFVAGGQEGTPIFDWTSWYKDRGYLT